MAATKNNCPRSRGLYIERGMAVATFFRKMFRLRDNVLRIILIRKSISRLTPLQNLREAQIIYPLRGDTAGVKSSATERVDTFADP